MKNFLWLALTAIVGFYSPSNSAGVDTSWALRKSGKWLLQNQSLQNPKLEVASDVIYEKDVLFEKLLEIIEAEKPFGDHAYNLLFNLISMENSLAKKNQVIFYELINDLDMTEAQKFKLEWILKEKSTEVYPVEAMVTSKAEVSIVEVIKSARAAIGGMKLPSEIKHKLIGSLDTVKKVLLDSVPDDDCYNTSAGCQFEGNRGIVRYYSRRIHENHALALAVFKLGIRVQHLNKKYADWLKTGPQYDQKFDLNLWPLYLDVANGDPALALQVISVFGHDVTANQLANFGKNNLFLTSALNVMSPSKYGGDSNPESVIFLPGVIKGLLPSKKVVNKLRAAIAHHDKIFNTTTKMRHGYHHVHGGVLIAQELLKEGYGEIGTVDSSSLISQVMGYAYKRLQMVKYVTKDAAVLWKQTHENEFKKVRVPKDWTEERFQKALASLKLHQAVTDFTEDQHRVGARFAVKVYQD